LGEDEEARGQVERKEGMKVTINFGDEINDAVQQHLDGGASVQDYVRGALAFFNQMRAHEKSGKAVGYGEKSRFSAYNTVVSPEDYI
jgi:hypothetical protein